MATSIILVVILVLYLGGLIAFALFYGKEEGTTKAYVVAFAAGCVSFVLGGFVRAVIPAVMAAATFYVADRKNRSRSWAIPAILFGPLVLFVVVLLPKRVDTKLSVNSPFGSS